MPLRISGLSLFTLLCPAGLPAADEGYPVEAVIAGFEQSIAPV